MGTKAYDLFGKKQTILFSLFLHRKTCDLSEEFKNETRRFRYILRDTCSWNGMLVNTRSWKDRSEVGKFGLKLESTTEIGKWLMKLESFDLTGKESMKSESYD